MGPEWPAARQSLCKYKTVEQQCLHKVSGHVNTAGNYVSRMISMALAQR